MNLIKRITKNVLDATFHLVNLKKNLLALSTILKNRRMSAPRSARTNSTQRRHDILIKANRRN
jgi:hypothetical protein